MPEKGFPEIGLSEALDIFHTANRARQLTPATLRYYQKTLGLFIRWAAAHDTRRADQVTPALIRRYLVESADAGRASHTVHKYARALRTWFTFLAREELIERSPMQAVVMPRVETKLPTSFTQSEAAAILKACTTDRDKTICMVLLDTGLRASELCAVNVGDVDIRAGTILVRKGKGRKERTVFIGAKTGRQVARLLGQMGRPAPTAPLVVSTSSGYRLTYSGLGHMMTRLREQTGVAHLSAHTFRRTFAIWSLRSGMSIYHLQRLLGHADIGTLKHYLGLIEADLQTAHAEHGPIDHWLK